MDSNGNGRLMTIREVSSLTDVPPHTLRFWEKTMPDILCPERTPGGQRRYTAEIVERVRRIKQLADEKRYSLAAIRQSLQSSRQVSKPQPPSRKKLQTDRIVDLIIDEIAGLLKERLLPLLEVNGRTEGSGTHE